ncbi:MAG TPA: hypothetical protein VHZ54_10945 [Solirubrobacterales bacterium]|jgi:hypothetical protein|nr:hypothetical protein [Solirubrobacterales bacterium]
MNARQLQQALAAADPVDRARLDRLDFEAMEADLLADAEGDLPPLPGLEPGRPRRRARRRLVPALAGATALAVAIVTVALLSAGGGHPARAYGAELVRFAESTPLLLLERPGWRVQHVDQEKARIGSGSEGSMEFVTGKPIPYESVFASGGAKEPREKGMHPPAVRQRLVQLSWRHWSLAQAIELQRGSVHPHGQRWVKLPVLGTTAAVDTRAEFYVNQGGPGNREMRALWREGGYTLELEAAVPDQAAFEERLSWLTKVDTQSWLEAMPAAVVKAADFHGTVREMVKDIPLPKTFSIARVPNEGLTTDREAIGSKVAGTVTCLWLRQWGDARRTGDEAVELEADRAMATSRHWKILTDVESTNGYSPLVWEVAASMPRGYVVWAGRRRSLLAHAGEGLGCADLGVPLYGGGR